MRRPALFSVVLFSSLLTAYGLRAGDAEEYLRDCGRNCLFILLNDLGYTTDLDSVIRALPPRPPAGFSMAELESAASALGLRLQGIRLDKGQLPLKKPVIAYITPSGEGHFIILRPVGSTGKVVQVIDPPSSPAVVDYDQLLASPAWTGRILVPQSRGEWLLSRSWVVPLVGCVLLVVEWGRRRNRRTDDPRQRRGRSAGTDQFQVLIQNPTETGRA